LANTAWLIDAFASMPNVDILTPTATDRRSGIVTFRPQNANLSQLHAALTDKGVICAQRGGGIRFSPHFYIPESDLERAVTELEQILK
jgi:selenocysteine lyase/cysteine desulfurase